MTPAGEGCHLYNLPVEVSVTHTVIKKVHRADAVFDQLLYEVFVLSKWPALPHTSRFLHATFKSAPSSVVAEYLICRYLGADRGARGNLVSKVLRYPICTQVVLETMLRLPSCPPNKRSDHIELPRRLFRGLSSKTSELWSRTDTPLPFLQFLYSHPEIPPPDANSWDGYALTKATSVGFIPLVRFLLDKGATPIYKRCLAVHAAIRRKDLSLVKMLIEPDQSVVREQTPPRAAHVDHAGGSQSTRKRERETRSDVPKRTAKKRRMEDRVKVDQAMLKVAVGCDARDIVHYFVHEKSCMPDMQTVRMMPNILRM